MDLSWQAVASLEDENFPAVHVAHNESLVVVPAVKPSPIVHEVTVTAAHAFPFVPAFHVDPATQLVQMPSLVVVAGVSPLPVVHVVVVTAAHGVYPKEEKSVPATHAYEER